MESEIKTFEELEAYKANRAFRMHIFQHIMPSIISAKEFNLADQLKRSSRSITANIAEGYGRFHFQDNAKFCTIARGSLYESLEHCITANDEALISNGVLDNARKLFDPAVRILNGYINYLYKSSNQK